MKKRVLGVMALASIIGLVGCGQTEEVKETPTELVTELSEPVEIEFWHTMSGALGETIDTLVKNFNGTVGAEKGITVESVYQGGYADAKAKVVASLKAGTSPHVIQGTINDVKEYLQSGAVQSLNEYIFNEKVGIEDFEDIYEVYRTESSSYDQDGTFYSLPFAKSTDLLFYNKTFMDEHGFEMPTTWDGLTELAQQITDITGKPALSFDNTTNYFVTSLFQLGAEYTNIDGEVLFNSPESMDSSVKALTLLKDNYDKGIWRLVGEDKYSSAPFLSQNVQMYIGSSAGASYLGTAEFEWEAVNIPQFDENNVKNIQQGNNISVFNQNKSSEEVYASYEFVKYLASYEANLHWVLNTGYLPLRATVSQSPEYVEMASSDSVKASGVNAVESGFTEPIFATDTLNSNMVRNEVWAMTDNILLNDMDIVEALNFHADRLK